MSGTWFVLKHKAQIPYGKQGLPFLAAALCLSVQALALCPMEAADALPFLPHGSLQSVLILSQTASRTFPFLHLLNLTSPSS